MLIIERFVNELMSSNCYLVWDNSSLRCLIIDPASEKSSYEIDFIERNNLYLDYILLTHEHTDHTWGVNALLDKYPKSRVICSQKCKDNLPKAGDMYFQLYYENTTYHYEVARVDLTVEEINHELSWGSTTVYFIDTPGHSAGSVCIDIENNLFSGDTIMQSKPYINKKNGCLKLFKDSINYIFDKYKPNTMVYPGHGKSFCLENRYLF